MPEKYVKSSDAVWQLKFYENSQIDSTSVEPDVSWIYFGLNVTMKPPFSHLDMAIKSLNFTVNMFQAKKTYNNVLSFSDIGAGRF